MFLHKINSSSKEMEYNYIAIALSSQASINRSVDIICAAFPPLLLRRDSLSSAALCVAREISPLSSLPIGRAADADTLLLYTSTRTGIGGADGRKHTVSIAIWPDFTEKLFEILKNEL